MQRFILISFGFFITACGGESGAPLVSTYALSQNPPVSSNLCPSQTALDWNRLVASRCNHPEGEEGARFCYWGAREFEQRNFAYIQGPGCAIAVAQMQGGPGNSWQGQQFYQINEPILQSGIFGQYGWAAGPNWPLDRREPRAMNGEKVPTSTLR